MPNIYFFPLKVILPQMYCTCASGFAIPRSSSGKQFLVLPSIQSSMQTLCHLQLNNGFLSWFFLTLGTGKSHTERNPVNMVDEVSLSCWFWPKNPELASTCVRVRYRNAKDTNCFATIVNIFCVLHHANCA